MPILVNPTSLINVAKEVLNPATAEVVHRLNDDDLNKLARQTDALAHSQTLQNNHNKDIFTYFVAFDGTGNNRDDAKSYAGGLTTNVAELQNLAFVEDEKKKLANFETKYYKGPGTEGSTMGSAVIPIAVKKEIQDTAQLAYRNFAISAQQWLKTHPDGEIDLYLTGFSRGGVTAAVFSQLVYENGLKTADGQGYLVAPTQLGIAGGIIYDPVSTGYSKNAAFAPNAKNINLVVAENEYRSSFNVVDHKDNPNVRIFPVMGNHSNIGGGYDNGIGAKVLEASHEWLKKAGVPLAEIGVQRQFAPHEAVIYHERNLPSAAGKDWPIDHDPKHGLREKRLTAGDAQEAVRLSSGQVVFESMSGRTVYTEKTRPNGIDTQLEINDRVSSHLLLSHDKTKILSDIGASERLNNLPPMFKHYVTPTYDLETKQGIMKVIENIDKGKWDRVTGTLDNTHPAVIGVDLAFSQNERYTALSVDKQVQVVQMFIETKNQELEKTLTANKAPSMERSIG